MILPRAAAPPARTTGPVLASLVVAAGLVALVGVDYASTRSELIGLLRQHALALRETVAASARSNRAAAALSASQIGERLLGQARQLAALDADRELTPGVAARIADRTPLFRLLVFEADGSTAAGFASIGGADRGRGGPHGPGWGPGRLRSPTSAGAEATDPIATGRPASGGGRRGAGQVARQILEEGRLEAVTGLHEPRWGGGGRIAAGVRRSRGGAIVVTVDATAIARLEAPASLETLLAEITRQNPGLAYTVFEHEDGRLAFGEPPPDADAPASAAERQLEVAGRPVLEFAGEIPIAGGAPARLRLGMRLDDLRRVERRMAMRLAASLVVSAALLLLAFRLSGLDRRYGLLSARHARAEEALRRRDRLSAMGELASTVAHEVRNPLNAVGMTAQRLRREFLDLRHPSAAERQELAELLEVMTSETRRIDRIVQQFLDYARPPRLELQPTDLPSLVRSLADQTRAFAEAKGVTLDVRTPAGGEVVVDGSQIRQALENLVRNAVEASPEGGTVTITARCPRGGCTVDVSDQGPGITAEDLSRIFDLYFTTKPEGTGVGLAVTQQIVTAHGGTIEVESKPGATTMTVRLPRPEDAR